MKNIVCACLLLIAVSCSHKAEKHYLVVSDNFRDTTEVMGYSWYVTNGDAYFSSRIGDSVVRNYNKIVAREGRE